MRAGVYVRGGDAVERARAGGLAGYFAFIASLSADSYSSQLIPSDAPLRFRPTAVLHGDAHLRIARHFELVTSPRFMFGDRLLRYQTDFSGQPQRRLDAHENWPTFAQQRGRCSASFASLPSTA